MPGSPKPFQTAREALYASKPAELERVFQNTLRAFLNQQPTARSGKSSPPAQSSAEARRTLRAPARPGRV